MQIIRAGNAVVAHQSTAFRHRLNGAGQREIGGDFNDVGLLGLIAKMPGLLAEHLKQRLHFGEQQRIARRQNIQLAGCGYVHPPQHRCGDITDVALRVQQRQPFGQRHRDRRHIDVNRSRPQLLQQPAFHHYLLGGGIVGQHGDQYVHLRQFFRLPSLHGPGAHQRLCCLGRTVPYLYPIASLQQVGGHRAAHTAQAGKSDLHIAFLFSGYLPSP
ncbi:hypothetical protein D3C71_1470950 [compost metagenome]